MKPAARKSISLFTRNEKTTSGALPLQARRAGGTFRSLSYPNYRYLWLGQMGNSISMWMEQVVRPLLLLHMTGSAMQLGLIIGVRTVPVFIFGLLAGVVADRYDKRRVLMISQMVTMLTHLTLGLLVVSGLVQVWHIYVTALVAGGATAFVQPTRQALVPRLVPRDDLLNGLALNSAGNNSMRVLGASVAGLLLLVTDYGEIYLLNALIYVGIIWTTIQMSVPDESSGRKEQSSRRRGLAVLLSGDFVEVFRHLNTNRGVLYLVGMAILLFIFGQPYQQVFVPLMALNVLGIGRSGAGWMLALTGFGALSGSLIVASRGHLAKRGLIMMGMLVVFSLALILLAQSRWLLLSAAALILAGSMNTTYMALNNSAMLEKTPPEFHGRVMSLMSLDRGLMSLGAIFGATLAEALGPQTGLTIVASLCIAFTVLTFLLIPTLRRME